MILITLREIPNEGLQRSWSTEELKKTFKDLIGDQDLTVKVYVYPINDGFDVSGEITAHIPMDCSFCANMLPIPVSEKFHEVMLMTNKHKPKDSKEDVVAPDELELSYINGNEMDLTTLVRDTISLALPIQPKCLKKGAPTGYPECKADWDYEKYFEKHEAQPLANPFETLKNLKNLKKN